MTERVTTTVTARRMANMEWLPPSMEATQPEIVQAFEDRQVWIADMLCHDPYPKQDRKSEVSVPAREIEIRSADIDHTTNTLSVGFGLLHDTAREIEQFGAKMTVGEMLFSLTQEESDDLTERFTSVDKMIDEMKEHPHDKMAAQARKFYFPQFGVSSFDALRQAFKARQAKTLINSKIAETTAIDHEWHGFGGSVVSIKNAAQRAMAKWTDDNPNTHRVKVLWGIMGSENTRATRSLGRYFHYRLEEHGKRQINNAVTTFTSMVADTKRTVRDQEFDAMSAKALLLNEDERAESKTLMHPPIVKIRHITLNGHSMGGQIDYELMQEDDKIHDALMSMDDVIDKNVRVMYIINTPLTVGARFDRKAVYLLMGPGAFLGVGARLPFSNFFMSAADRVKLIPLIHNHFFKTAGTDHDYERMAHIVQAGMDPSYLAQNWYGLYNAVDIRKTTRDRKVMQKVITEGRVIAIIGQADIVLNPERQFEDLFDLDIPLFSLIDEPHYVGSAAGPQGNEDNVIRMIISGNQDALERHYKTWVEKSVVWEWWRHVSYADELNKALHELIKFRGKRSVLKSAGLNDPMIDPKLQKHTKKLNRMLGRFFLENGWTFIDANNIMQTDLAVQNMCGDNKKLYEDVVTSPFIQAVIGYSQTHYGVASMRRLNREKIVTLMSEAMKLDESSKEFYLLSSQIQSILVYHDILRPEGLRHAAIAISNELPESTPGKPLSLSRLALNRHLKEMSEVSSASTTEASELIRNLGVLVAQYAIEQSPIPRKAA